MLTASCDGKPVAMLHLLPFETAFGPVAYIYGVATAAAAATAAWQPGCCRRRSAARRSEAAGRSS